MKTFNKNHFFSLLMIFPIAIFSKIFQFLILSDKYFIDSNKILNLILGNTNLYGSSYHITAEFFKSINFFHLSTLLDWSVFLAAILNLFFFIFLLKISNLKMFDYFYIYISIFLLNVFAFNLNKEILQIIFFFFVYFIFNNSKFSNLKKFILSSLVLFIESIIFRSYYILFIITFGFSYFILNHFYKNKYKNNSNSNLFKLVFISMFLFLLTLFSSKFIFPGMYSDLISVRNGYEYGLADANTLIKSIFTNNDNFFYYSLNYIINSIRIFFPFELLFKSLKYSFFIIYQLINVFIIAKGVKNVYKDNIVLISFLIGYFLLTGTYEPDFGSVIRHESVLMMFFVLAISKNNKYLIYINKGDDNNG